MPETANANSPKEFIRTSAMMLLEQARAVGLSPADAAASLHLATIQWSLRYQASDEMIERLRHLEEEL